MTWRRIRLEGLRDEAGIGLERELIEPSLLAGFGLSDREVLTGSR